MATTTVLHNTFSGSIPPDGTEFFVIGPADVFRTGGAITVTAVPRAGDPGTAKLFMEVVQTAIHLEPLPGGGTNYFLDIVVRNNSHKSDPANASTITNYDVFTSVINP